MWEALPFRPLSYPLIPDFHTCLSSAPQTDPSTKNTVDRSAQQRQWVDKAQHNADAAAAAAAHESASSSASDHRHVQDGSSVPLALAGAAATMRPSSSTSSLSRSRGGAGSSSQGSMIPLSVAQEAEERQRQWLKELQRQIDAPDIARQLALDADRSLRQEQDLEYQKVRPSCKTFRLAMSYFHSLLHEELSRFASFRDSLLPLNEGTQGGQEAAAGGSRGEEGR